MSSEARRLNPGPKGIPGIPNYILFIRQYAVQVVDFLGKGYKLKAWKKKK
ncbi:MAG: hypothetical protein GXP44_01015 [bacterium]|nr:hypothetical protein [bacterium]